MDRRWVRDRAERGQVCPSPDDCHLDLLFQRKITILEKVIDAEKASLPPQ